jgi:hypothetical protein
MPEAAARRTMPAHANEAIAENAAVQEATELPLDKCGYAATCCLGLGEDGLEVVLDHPVKKCTASTKRSAESAPGLARTVRE